MSDLVLLAPQHSRYSWRFDQSGLDVRDAFVAAFLEYNEGREIDGAGDFVLLSAPSAIVRFAGVPSEHAGEYEAMEVEVRDTLNEPLGFLDFMFRMHTLVHPFLIDADHVYFEGLTAVGCQHGVPVLEMRQGS